MDDMDDMDEMPSVAQASRSAFSVILSRGSPFPMGSTSAVPDSAFATIMSLPQPQQRPRASPLIPRSVPAPPKTKSFSLPNALSRVGTPVAKGTWILGRGDETESNGYVRTVVDQALMAWDAPEQQEPRTADGRPF